MTDEYLEGMKRVAVGSLPLLLVWEMVPEDVDCYILDNASEQAQWARESAGKYINYGDIPNDHSIYKLNDWLQADEAKNCLRDNEKPISGPFSEVVVCGFGL